MALEASELIVNDDGSIYHLNLRPEDLADIIITVGDPDRVALVASFFDKIEVKKQKREFYSQTGTYNGKRITVISTGIGTDNIDIVLNELDALVNIDLEKRTLKEKTKALTIVRIGTSGALQSPIPVDSYLVSEGAVGFDGLLHYYKHPNLPGADLAEALHKHLNLHPGKALPYYVDADRELLKKLSSDLTYTGITGTNIGFYAPQGRFLRAEPSDLNLVDKIASFEYQGKRIANMEMESSAIFALSAILGHKAIAVNAIIANRANGTFSEDYHKVMMKMIPYVLDRLTV